MKFNCQVTINRPIHKVIELFDNPDHLKEWQDGFVSFEHLSGEPGKVGVKSRLIYELGKKKKPMELIETITVKNFPHEFSGIYVHEHMTNTMVNRFTESNPNQTQWNSEITYTQFNGFMIKVMATLLPGMFKKQTQKWMDQFKAFAERVN